MLQCQSRNIISEYAQGLNPPGAGQWGFGANHLRVWKISGLWGVTSSFSTPSTNNSEHVCALITIHTNWDLYGSLLNSKQISGYLYLLNLTKTKLTINLHLPLCLHFPSILYLLACKHKAQTLEMTRTLQVPKLKHFKIEC